MAIPTRWHPIRQIARFDPFPELEDLVRSFGLHSPLARQYEHTLEMRMDVHEDDKGYRVTIDMPGVKKEDIDVSIEGNQVTVTAEVKREQGGEAEKELYSERYSGKAFRSFTVPSDIDSGSAEANYDGGVLRLVLPKKAGSPSRKLSVN
ncbi:Hsp20/alpha crystallin family protein [Lysobacter niastensis]|uniref:Hsp20/alpha crystallin family protein n=1 Tax=Lysobacter niastensis TaxID=380629 RepID=A0ABS0B735_9GAMM|nr:Hsp20/alpha crystallin family protein [Lysobacter niastensis]MBF6024836.1 Hsp20/alpha crystallin family protein [Lysobacter niastensis]